MCALAHQCHGAIGFANDYDPLLIARAKTVELDYGNSDYHRVLAAQGVRLW